SEFITSQCHQTRDSKSSDAAGTRASCRSRKKQDPMYFDNRIPGKCQEPTGLEQCCRGERPAAQDNHREGPEGPEWSFRVTPPVPVAISQATQPVPVPGVRDAARPDPVPFPDIVDAARPVTRSVSVAKHLDLSDMCPPPHCSPLQQTTEVPINAYERYLDIAPAESAFFGGVSLALLDMQRDTSVPATNTLLLLLILPLPAARGEPQRQHTSWALGGPIQFSWRVHGSGRTWAVSSLGLHRNPCGATRLSVLLAR
ncbi:hypothetical protein P4O66_021355, partial [Electrophorus voltai]